MEGWLGGKRGRGREKERSEKEEITVANQAGILKCNGGGLGNKVGNFWSRLRD